MPRVEEHLHVTSVEAALKKAQQINTLIERGEYVTLHSLREGQHVTFAALVDEFRQNYTGWSSNTLKGAEALMGILVREWGPLPAQAITNRMINAYLARRVDQGEITPATANRYLSFLRRLFDQGVRWGHLGHSPAQSVKFLKEQNRIPEALTEGQLEAMLKHLSEDARAVVILAVDTGMRSSEFSSLTWQDVRWDTRELVVRKSKNDEFRVIPMTNRVCQLLSQLREQAGKEKVQSLKVLPSVDLKYHLHKAGVKAKLGHVHPHMLRHTFATRLRDRGVPLDRIKELLGHKTLMMVLRYAKARPTQLREAIAALND
jgi:integrase